MIIKIKKNKKRQLALFQQLMAFSECREVKLPNMTLDQNHSWNIELLLSDVNHGDQSCNSPLQEVIEKCWS